MNHYEVIERVKTKVTENGNAVVVGKNEMLFERWNQSNKKW